MGTVLKNRQALAEHFAALGFNVGVEVGVCHGEYSKVLLRAMPGLTLYGVDSYRRRPSDRKVADERLAEWIAEGRFTMLQMSSTRAMGLFGRGSVDFVSSTRATCIRASTKTSRAGRRRCGAAAP